MGNTPLRKSPLQLPTNSAEFLRTFVFDRAPLSTDFRNFKISDLWIQRNPGGSPDYGYFVLVDKPQQSGVWIDLGGKTLGDVQTLTGDSGGAVPPDTNGNINVLGGTRVEVSGDPGTNTLTWNVTGTDFNWQVDTTTPILLVSQIGNIENSGSQIVYNLPNTCEIGDTFAIVATTSNGFQVDANPGQTMRYGNQLTTDGGTITSTSVGDVLSFLCTTTDTQFVVLNSIGNLTVG